MATSSRRTPGDRWMNHQRRHIRIHVDCVEHLDFREQHAPALAAGAPDADVAGGHGILRDDPVGIGQPAAGRQVLEERRFVEFPRDISVRSGALSVTSVMP